MVEVLDSGKVLEANLHLKTGQECLVEALDLRDFRSCFALEAWPVESSVGALDSQELLQAILQYNPKQQRVWLKP